MASRYLKQLARDLPRWAEQGLIKKSSISAILDDAKANKSAMPLANIVAILGAVLLCFAVITLVAANWQVIPRLYKLTMLIAILWTTYVATWICFKKNMVWLGHSALLIASAVFGANIMLIAQMYHLQGDAPIAVLIWACGALLAGTLVRSSPSIILAALLFATWSLMRAELFSSTVHYPFLAAWLVTALITKFWVRSRVTAHLLAILLMGWLFSSSSFEIFLHAEIASHLTIWAMPVTLFAVSLLIESNKRQRWLGGFEIAAIPYLLIFLFATTFMLQFMPSLHSDTIARLSESQMTDRLYQLFPYALVVGSTAYFAIKARMRGDSWLTHTMIGLWAGGVIFLLFTLRTPMGDGFLWAILVALLFFTLSVWTIRVGDRLHSNAIKAVGFLGFGAELLYVYFTTIGGFLGTTLLFFFGGAVMIIVAIFVMRRSGKSSEGSK